MSNGMNIKPLGSRVLIEPVSEDKKTKSGIVLPENASGEKPMIGKVVATGPGKFDDGKLVPMTVKVGDQVIYKKYGPDEIEVEGKKYLVGDEDDILAILS
jgi:chaperonin GroES